MWNECKDLQEYIVGLRRDLHQIPELGLHLPETAAYVTTELDKIGIPYICSKKDSGIIATIKGRKAGKDHLPARRYGCSSYQRRDRTSICFQT